MDSPKAASALKLTKLCSLRNRWLWDSQGSRFNAQCSRGLRFWQNSTISSSHKNAKVYTTAHSRSSIVRREPGVNFCRPFWMAAMPLDADTSVVMTASDATKVLEFSFMLVIRLAMVSRMTGISGRKRKNSSTTLSTVKPGRVLTTTSSHISSGKNAVSRKSVACPA